MTVDDTYVDVPHKGYEENQHSCDSSKVVRSYTGCANSVAKMLTVIHRDFTEENIE